MSESQSVLLDKKIYIKIKKQADYNECSVEEEIGAAVSWYYEGVEESLLEEIAVIPRKDKIMVVFPENLYTMIEEGADENETDLTDELGLVLDEYLFASEEAYEEEEESDEDSEEYEEDEEEEYIEEEERTSSGKGRGFFGKMGDMIDDILDDDKK